jgi:hypothetical protein
LLHPKLIHESALKAAIPLIVHAVRAKWLTENDLKSISNLKEAAYVSVHQELKAKLEQSPNAANPVITDALSRLSEAALGPNDAPNYDQHLILMHLLDRLIEDLRMKKPWFEYYHVLTQRMLLNQKNQGPLMQKVMQIAMTDANHPNIIVPWMLTVGGKLFISKPSRVVKT